MVKGCVQADLVECGWQEFGNSNRTVQTSPAYYDRAHLSQALSDNRIDLCYPWGKMFKVSVVENFKLRFVEGLSSAEDALFCSNFIVNANDVCVIDYIGYNYRMELTKSYIMNPNEYILSVTMGMDIQYKLQEVYNINTIEKRCVTIVYATLRFFDYQTRFFAFSCKEYIIYKKCLMALRSYLTFLKNRKVGILVRTIFLLIRLRLYLLSFLMVRFIKPLAFYLRQRIKHK